MTKKRVLNNPYAICAAQTGTTKSKVFERCVKKVKKRLGIRK